jgi:hypothetical protein
VEHKITAFDYLFNRLNTYPLNKTNKNVELQIINQIARENDYHPNSTVYRKNINRKPALVQHSKPKTPPANSLENNKKWAVFTYVGKQTRHISKLFKNTNIKPALTTTNTLKKHLFPNQRTIDI